MTSHNIADAKMHLSRLLDAALAGEEVILARAGTPLARLVPIAAPARRSLGFVSSPMPDDRFEPLDEAEIAAWS